MRRSCGMSVSSSSLPAGFDALTPFVDFWAADTAAGRAHCRDVSDDVARLGFYNAMVGQVPDALAYLDAKRSEEHTSELQSLMRISYADFCLKKKKHKNQKQSSTA